MLTYNVLQLTPYPAFNWAFTAVIVWVPVLFVIKACVRTLTRT